MLTSARKTAYIATCAASCLLLTGCMTLSVKKGDTAIRASMLFRNDFTVSEGGSGDNDGDNECACGLEVRVNRPGLSEEGRKFAVEAVRAGVKAGIAATGAGAAPVAAGGIVERLKARREAAEEEGD